MKKISIIIPHKNNMEGLKRLLNSIPENDEVEVIVVDDHSEGKIVRDLFSEFVSPNLSIYQNETNIYSAGKARNIGLEKVTGEWLLFADSDDYFVEGWLDTIYRYIDAEEELIYFIPTSIHEETEDFSTRHIPRKDLIKAHLNKQNMKTEYQLRGKFPEPWSKMIKLDLVKRNKILFDETRYANDVSFSKKVGIYANKIKSVDKTIYCVTENNTSLTKQISEESIKIRVQVYVESVIFSKQNLTNKQFRYATSSALQWYGTGIKNKFSKTYYKHITSEIIKNKLPIRPFSFLETAIKKYYIYRGNKK